MNRRLKTKDIPVLKEKLFKKQKGRCALCNCRMTDSKDICLDHCHVSGVIRALLCRNCNAMEGKVFNCSRRAKRDGTPYDWLSRVVWYWAEHASIKPDAIFHPSHRTADEKRLRRNKRAAKKRREKKELILRTRVKQTKVPNVRERKPRR